MPRQMQTPSRREYLLSVGTIGTIGLAGCLGDDGDDNGGGDTGGDDTGGDGSGGGSDGGNGGSDYPSEDIRWLVPASPGGGFDSYSRAMADILPDHLPNEVEVVVENQGAAGGRVHAQEIYEADPDGYTMGIWNTPGQVVAEILDDDPSYSTQEITWLGRVVEEPYMYCVGADTPYETPEDLQNADQVLVGGQGPGNTGDLMNIITAEEIGFNMEHVRGFEGNADIYASVLRGEVEAFAGSIGSTQVIEGIQEGELRAIIAYAEPDGLPEWTQDYDIPMAGDLGYEQLIGTMSNHRLLGGPPDMDEEVTSTLEEALLSTLNSDEMQSWAEENDRPLAPDDGETTAETVNNMFDMMEQYRESFQEQGWGEE